jgi:hypothetical protein
MDGYQEDNKQVRDTFLKSRAGAILRCAEIMVDSGRKDLAKQILATTHIDRQRLIELKAQST